MITVILDGTTTHRLGLIAIDLLGDDEVFQLARELTTSDAPADMQRAYGAAHLALHGAPFTAVLTAAEVEALAARDEADEQRWGATL